MNIFVAILSLSFLIIVHEFGHFIVAKLSGIKVHEFSIFMGPKLLSIQKGETMYALRLVPIGGFVLMEGEEKESSDTRAYNKKPLLVRMAVIAAGPVMNLLTAIVILFFIFSGKGYDTSVISKVADNSPASQMGLMQGDKITGFDGKRIFNSTDVYLFSYISKEKPVNLTIKRGGAVFSRTLTPQVIPAQESYKLGFAPKADSGPDSTVVEDVVPNMPADKAGVKKGDQIVRLNGQIVNSRQDVASSLNSSKASPVEITVIRDSKEITLGSVAPILDKSPEQYFLGLDFETGHGNAFDILGGTVSYTFSNARSVFYSLVWLVSGKVSVNQMMGPVGIVSTIGEVVQQSPGLMQKFVGLMGFTAFISINLGVFNLIPFPALDGSKILLLAIEGIRRKALPPEKEAFISMIGLALLIMLMIFATSNDIMRIVQRG